MRTMEHTRTHLRYPLWTDKAPSFDDCRTSMAEPVYESDFDFWGNDRLLVLESIPRAYFDDPHWYFVAGRCRIRADGKRKRPSG